LAAADGALCTANGQHSAANGAAAADRALPGAGGHLNGTVTKRASADLARSRPLQ